VADYNQNMSNEKTLTVGHKSNSQNLNVYFWAQAIADVDDFSWARAIPGARFTKQTYNNFYPKFLVKQSYNLF